MPHFLLALAQVVAFEEVDVKLESEAAEGASVGIVPVNGQCVPVRDIFATQVANLASVQFISRMGSSPLASAVRLLGMRLGSRGFGSLKEMEISLCSIKEASISTRGVQMHKNLR